MEEKTNRNIDNAQAVAKTIAEEFQKNDDIVEYIRPDNLELLKARYAAAEEDESIRSEGFGLAQRGGLLRKPRPESVYGYYNSPQISKKDEIQTDASALNEIFESAQSEFDADSVSFGEIDLGGSSAGAAAIPAEKNETDDSKNIETFSLSKDFNTNTKVVFSEEIGDDGIKRNTDEEMESVFLQATAKKHKFLRRNKNDKQK